MRKPVFLILLLLATGCLKNDIPYPVVKCAIEAIEAEGLSGAPVIDAASQTITLPLQETTDIQAVSITSATLTEGAVPSVQLTGTHDLRNPLNVTLSLYQDYTWTVSAAQTILRTFAVEGQIGATEWNEAEHAATVRVGFEDLSSVSVSALKLGPAGISVMSCADVPVLDESTLYQLSDFRSPRRVMVTYHGRSETWYLTVEHTDMRVNLERADGWVRTAWLYGSGESGAEAGFCYRPEGGDAWIPVPASEIEVNGGSFRARVRGLEPGSRYEAVACSGPDTSAVVGFATEAELPLPNAGFEDWSKPGSIVYPYLSEAQAFWDTGNKGSSAVNETVTESSPDIRPGSSGSLSAALTSKFASLFGIGKFAAGNIFVGSYAETVGTNGKVNFGRPFTSRPVALRGWVKYTQGKIDRIGEQPQGHPVAVGDNDQGSIYIAVGTWTAEEYGGTPESPVQVYTREQSTFFNSKAPAVVGYGEWIIDEQVGEWRQFTIPLDYRATNIAPTHLIIVCSASRWGDYFTGSSQSRMWLDDFELVWE